MAGRRRRDKPRRDPDAVGGALPAAPVRPAFTAVQTAAIVARHALPLALLGVLGGSIETFLVLSVFNIALSLSAIAVVGVGVSMRQEGGRPADADPPERIVSMLLVGAGTTALLTALFGWVAVLIAEASPSGLWNAEFAGSALAILVVALFDAHRQYRAELAANLPEATRKHRDRPLIGGLLVGAILVFLLSGFAAAGGRAGSIALAGLLTALFVLRDLRPDLMPSFGDPPPSAD